MSVFIPGSGPGNPKISFDTAPGKDHSVQPGKKNFADLLDKQLHDFDGPMDATPPHASLGEIQTIFKPVLEVSRTPSTDNPISQMEQILGLFDEYTQALSNPENTLKQAHAILEKIVSQSLGLSAALEEDTEAQGLMPLLNQMLTSANVEQIKIQRGDYTI